MILAAGEGTRMRPLTDHIPKALLPVKGLPSICYTLTWLGKHGILGVAINLHHLGEKVEEYLGDGSRYGMKVLYSFEEFLLGTAGGVKRVAGFFDGTFVVVYGDVVTDFDLSSMVRFHKQRESLATLALLEVPNPWEKGIVGLDTAGRVIDFVEKPPKGTEKGDLSNGGIYVLEREILNFVPAEAFCDFAYDVFPQLIRANLPVYGYVLSPRDYLIDIGTPAKYDQVVADAEAGKLANIYPTSKLS